jgi:hypothetical protein
LLEKFRIANVCLICVGIGGDRGLL